VDSSELISWRMPTYRISDLEIKEILAPMNSVMADDRGSERGERDTEKEAKTMVMMTVSEDNQPLCTFHGKTLLGETLKCVSSI
jgi:hypothetical protein